jgi:pyruvate/2-oxoglutarate dehydrogenase complex dihydrolipoamide acyltransferase (E2) component
MTVNHRIGTYKILPFSRNRRNIALVLGEGARSHDVDALIEVDVTDARDRIRHYEGETGVKISFTGWIIKCVAEAVDRHKTLNVYRHGWRRRVMFDDVDIPIPIEREAEGEQRPMPYILRGAQEKDVLDITREIRQVQGELVDCSTQLLGGDLTLLERFAIAAPGIVQRLLLWILRRNAFLKKKHMGTVGVTSIGMFGKFHGWAIPISIPAVLIVVGGVTKKPGVVGESIEIREYLHLTITVDHDLVDGGPLARFVASLTELTENAFGLPAV